MFRDGVELDIPDDEFRVPDSEDDKELCGYEFGSDKQDDRDQ